MDARAKELTAEDRGLRIKVARMPSRTEASDWTPRSSSATAPRSSASKPVWPDSLPPPKAPPPWPSAR